MRKRLFKFYYYSKMAKRGSEKNTKNKAKHAKLMDRKKNKKRKEENTRKAKLKAIVQKAKEGGA